MSRLPYSLDLFGPLAPSAEPEITPTPLYVGRGETLVSRVRVDYNGLAILSLLAKGLLGTATFKHTILLPDRPAYLEMALYDPGQYCLTSVCSCWTLALGRWPCVCP